LQVHFCETPNADELRHYHPEEVTVECDENGCETWRTCSDTGYVMHVSSLGATVTEARAEVYRRVGNVVIPKMFYRSDIGTRFLERDRELLEWWGYV
jgi:phosphoribosylamine--glycine ligase